ENRLADHEIGERIVERERSKNKETICRDALQHIDVLMLKAAAELQFMTSAYPAQRAGVVVSILITASRSGDGRAHSRITADDKVRSPGGDTQAGIIVKAQVAGCVGS